MLHMVDMQTRTMNARLPFYVEKEREKPLRGFPDL